MLSCTGSLTTQPSLAVADRRVLNKVDPVSDDAGSLIERRLLAIQAIVPAARLLRSRHADLPSQQMLAVQASRLCW